MKKLGNVTDSTLQQWHRRQNIFLGIIIASFALIGYMTIAGSSAQTVQPASQVQNR